MQLAEADMAADKGVPVLVLDMLEFQWQSWATQIKQLPAWKELIALAQEVKMGRKLQVPLTRQEQSSVIEEHQCEIAALRIQVQALRRRLSHVRNTVN